MEFKSTMDVQLIDYMGNDETIAHAARVSTLGQQAATPVNTTRTLGLINFLMKNRHGSPFEHGVMTFLVSAPIFVWREHMRHRIASYNEESGRYKQLEPTFYLPSPERPLVQEGKAGAYTFVAGTEGQVAIARGVIKNSSATAYAEYKSMIELGVAKEVARMVLPVNIYSSAYVTMNLRGLMNFLSLRTKNEGATFPSYPQAEIEMVAREYEKLFAAKFPIVYRAFVDNGYVAP